LQQRSRIAITRNVGDQWHIVEYLFGDYHFSDGFWALKDER
jgi:hypothetical protein